MHLKRRVLRHKKTSIFMLLIILIIGYIVYRTHFNGMPPQGTKVVEAEVVKLRSIQQTARFIGTIRSEQATTLIAKSRGILDRFVNAGQHIKKSELIAKIENKDIERNYKLAQEMEQLSKLQYERFKELKKTGVVSQNVLEEKKSAWLDAQRTMFTAKMAMDEINIYAPFDGIVGIFKIREGSQVQEGDTIVTFYDPSAIIVEFDVPLSMMNAIHDGSTVFVGQKSYPLTHIQKMLDEDTHMSPAYVTIQCADCIIGSTVDVDVVVKEKKSVFVIPYEAVFLQQGKNFVYIVKDEKAVPIPVELGIREKALVEILSGLHENDQVIVTGQARLYPGAPVMIDTKQAPK